MELFNAILPDLMNILMTVLLALVTYLGVLAKNFLNEQIKLAKQKTKKDDWDMIVQIIAHTVAYVRQTFKALDGEKKFEEARKKIIQLATEQGIELSEIQLKVITESIVNEFKKQIDDVDLNPIEFKKEGTE